jgi:hypothetical protein
LVAYVFFEENNEGDKQKHCVDVIVKQQQRLIIIHFCQNFRSEDSVQRHKHGRNHAGSGAEERKVDLAINAQIETKHNEEESGAGRERCGLPKNQKSKDNIENNRQGSGHWNKNNTTEKASEVVGWDIMGYIFRHKTENNQQTNRCRRTLPHISSRRC